MNMGRFVWVFAVMVLLFLTACSSAGPGTADFSGVWGVFVSDQDLVSDSAPVRTDTVSTCNDRWISSDPDTGIEIWQVTQSDSRLVVTDATTGEPLAGGTWLLGTLSLAGAAGDWSAVARVREGYCCFDATGTDGRHRHAIKMGGAADGCATGQDPWEANLTEIYESGSTVIATAGGDVEYAIWGETGPYILTFHGGQGGYDQIRAFAPGIIGQGYRILTWSRPGYLRTPLSDDSSPDEQADLAAALLDALGIDRVAVFGGSAGGPPLFSFALRHPDRVWAMIAESAVSQTYVPHSDYPYVNELVYLFENPGGMWIYNAMFEYDNEATARILLRTVSTLSEAAFDAWIAGIMADPDRVQEVGTILVSMAPSEPRMAGTVNDLDYDAGLGDLPLEGITAPTLIVHGTNDGDVDPANAEYSAATIPGAEMLWVTEGTHLLVLADDATAITQAELDFLVLHAP